MPFRTNIGIVVNISVKELTAHPIFCLQLAHSLVQFGNVTLYVPGRHRVGNVDELERKLGFSLDFEIKTVTDRVLGKRSLRLFFYLSVLRLWIQGKNLLWAFEPYSIRLATILGIRSVLEIHSSLPPARYIKTCLKIQKSYLFRSFIVNSHAHSRLLASKGFLLEKLHAAHNAISETLLTGQMDSNSKKQFWSGVNIKHQFVITYAGSLYKGRGVELMLEIAPQLSDTAFVILGGPEDKRLEFERQRRSDNVYFLGHIDHRAVPSYLRASDILVAIYNKDCEDIGGNKTILTASPMKLFEYMAAGVPVISSDLGAIPEIIKSGETGILVSPEDADAFLDAIRKILDDTGLRERMKTAALENVRQYTWPNRLTSIFNRLDSSS